MDWNQVVDRLCMLDPHYDSGEVMTASFVIMLLPQYI